MMTKILLEEQENAWKKMLSKSQDTFLKIYDHIVFFYSPCEGFLDIGTSENPLKDNLKFPIFDDYVSTFSSEGLVFDSDEEVIHTFCKAYSEDGEYELYAGEELLNAIEIGDFAYNEPIVLAVADWTAEFLYEISSPIRTLYFADGDGIINITYEIN